MKKHLFLVALALTLIVSLPAMAGTNDGTAVNQVAPAAASVNTTPAPADCSQQSLGFPATADEALGLVGTEGSCDNCNLKIDCQGCCSGPFFCDTFLHQCRCIG